MATNLKVNKLLLVCDFNRNYAECGISVLLLANGKAIAEVDK